MPLSVVLPSLRLALSPPRSTFARVIWSPADAVAGEAVRASIHAAETSLLAASSLTEIATVLTSLQPPPAPGVRFRDAQSPSAWRPRVVATALERCAAVGNGAEYASTIQPAIVAAVGRAAFRPGAGEYARMLGALLALRDDNATLHEALARGFLWEAAHSQAADSADTDTSTRTLAAALKAGVALAHVVGGSSEGSSGVGGGAAADAAKLFAFQARSALEAVVGPEFAASLPPAPAAASVSLPRNVPLPVWLRSSDLERAFVRLASILAHRIAFSVAREGGGRARSVRVSTLVPVADAAVSVVRAAWVNAAIKCTTGAGVGLGGGAGGGATEQHPLRNPAAQAAVRLIARLNDFAGASIPHTALYDFWRARATTASAGRARQRQYSAAALSSSTSGDEMGGGEGACGSDVGDGGDAPDEARRRARYSTHDVRAPATSAHVWAPAMLAAAKDSLALSLAVAPYSTALPAAGSATGSGGALRVGQVRAADVAAAVHAAAAAVASLAHALKLVFGGATRTASFVKRNWELDLRAAARRTNATSARAIFSSSSTGGGADLLRLRGRRTLSRVWLHARRRAPRFTRNLQRRLLPCASPRSRSLSCATLRRSSAGMRGMRSLGRPKLHWLRRLSPHMCFALHTQSFSTHTLPLSLDFVRRSGWKQCGVDSSWWGAGLSARAGSRRVRAARMVLPTLMMMTTKP